MPEMKNPDSSTFTVIADRAKAKINEYFGEWTDFNAHDPGITLIELFSWLAEIQRYFIDNSAGAELLFNLFDVKRYHAAPAEVRAEFTPENTEAAIAVPAGTPVYAENIRFETAARKLVRGTESVAVKIVSDRFNASVTDPILPFGAKPEAGKSFQVLLRNPPPADVLVISVEVSDTPRNQMNADECVFLSKLQWECLTSNGFVEIPAFDASCGLLMNGDIALDIGDEIVRDDGGNYVIRCTLLSNEYDIAPALISLKTNVVCLKQTHSLCEMHRLIPSMEGFRAGSYLAITGDNLLVYEKDGAYERIEEYKKTIDTQSGEAVFVPKNVPAGVVLLISCEHEYLHHRVLGMTRGFPNQRLKVEMKSGFIIYDDFCLLVADGPALDRSILWEKTDSLHRSGPRDRHYELDEQTGEIVFGDGFHGRMPAGVVFIASLAVTEGSGGNIKTGGLRGFKYAGIQIRAHQKEHAGGGSDRESGGAALKRAVSENLRAVTAEDYERIVKSTPGLIIERVSAFVPEGKSEGTSLTVTVAVKPWGKRAELSQAYKTRIMEWLEPHRLAGTSISVVPPVYVNIRMTAELVGREHLSDIRPVIEKKLRDYFSENFSHFGARICYGEVLAFLDSLPEVTRALSLHMRADGRGSAADDAGNISLEQRCIACLGQMDVFVY